MFFLSPNKLELPTPGTALPGRSKEMSVSPYHFINKNPLKGPFSEDLDQVIFGLGCFWGAERIFWQIEGVFSTSVGYAAGYTPNPTYEEVCSGHTGHNEVVLVVYNSMIVSFETLLLKFWEGHDPTQGMCQGNDTGTQYRSGVYVYTVEQKSSAKASRDIYQVKLQEAGYSDITTEILDAPPFYYAEDYHQQYLAKNPNGYCGLGGTGVSCPTLIELAAE